MGLLTRALCAGLSCLCVQFLKDGSSSELKGLSQLGAETMFSPDMTGFLALSSEDRRSRLASAQRKLFEKTCLVCKDGGFQVIFLDEVLDLCSEGVVTREELETFAAETTAELIMTGRNWWPELLELADYATRMECCKHPYLTGDPAKAKPRKGIEY